MEIRISRLSVREWSYKTRSNAGVTTTHKSGMHLSPGVDLMKRLLIQTLAANAKTKLTIVTSSSTYTLPVPPEILKLANVSTPVPVKCPRHKTIPSQLQQSSSVGHLQRENTYNP